MSSVAVVANSSKSLGWSPRAAPDTRRGRNLQSDLARGCKKPRSAECVRLVIEAGADLVFVWEGTGRFSGRGAIAHTKATLVVLPAGTGNLFAANLEISHDLQGAVATVFGGVTRSLTSDA